MARAWRCLPARRSPGQASSPLPRHTPAPSPCPLLFAGLLVSGVGTAVVPVAGAGALFRVYPAARRGWALGVRQMSVPLGGTVAALVPPGLESAGGVRLPLLAGR